MSEVKLESECVTADDWRHRAMHLESQWANCSQACARQQTRAEQAEAKLAASEAACAPFLKDGETPAECITRWRADAAAVLELLRQEKVRAEKAEAACAASQSQLGLHGSRWS